MAVIKMYHCSFCGKYQDDVLIMIAGPDVNICDECVDLCHEIVTKSRTKTKEGKEEKCQTK